ncbi:lysophospholipid transporter LplT [Thorsellia anophelis]|uniref:MFS transporter, LPLT family, lysophospholipid transporter n=1 Tax=Thorsellia anophelis DSM 18579 TaxID=1123402 RepID=A0A1I0BR95_9GAMM|nr:lysophospholipid transporter LplT [Thorsellia anophelis]SET09424.1 MFS transporter, LPLT family, lysophospholipid transporter [Thorsellia anophelis DSM 18579]
MNKNETTNEAVPLFNRGLTSVALAQFFSALADNALLFAILALAIKLEYASWIDPIFQLLFVGVYVITAPFVGSFADKFDKGKVMLISNGLKLVGSLLIFSGGNPFLGYVIVGLGAALYSPAKYGILGEVSHPGNLVKANGVIEASTIAAILIGAIAGGFAADHHTTFALGMCAALYFAALIANLYIPKLPAKNIEMSWHPNTMCKNFIQSLKVLLSDIDAKVSLLGTSLFWGAGITLRFLLIAWVPYVLNVVDKTTPSILNATVAIGIVIGSGLAAKFITLEKAKLALYAGVLMGICVVIAMLIEVRPEVLADGITHNLEFWAIQQALIPIHAMLILIGIFGGVFIVPLNALLQERGRDLIGVGKAIAAQNFSENSMMLFMLVFYTLFHSLGMSPNIMGIGFGGIFAITILIIIFKTMKNK